MRTGQNIYKRKDGRWEARVPLGIRANGRRYFKCFYGKTYQEARSRKQDYEKNIPSAKEILPAPAGHLFRRCLRLAGRFGAGMETGHLCPIQELSGEVYFTPMEAASCA